jgi:hypothetical protein
MRVSVSDQWLALHFHENGVPLKTVETALLLGSLRPLIRPADAPRLSPIRSRACFRPVIEELCEQPAPKNYREYLRLKLRQAAKTLSADDRKNVPLRPSTRLTCLRAVCQLCQMSGVGGWGYLG